MDFMRCRRFPPTHAEGASLLLHEDGIGTLASLTRNNIIHKLGARPLDQSEPWTQIRKNSSDQTREETGLSRCHIRHI